MYQFASARRKDDVVFLICQNNVEKVVTIKDCNRNVKSIFGYEIANLKEKGIETIFTQRVMELINTYLDYSDDDYNIGTILARIRKCGFVAQNGEQIDVVIKVFPVFSKRNKLFFEILVRGFSFFDQFCKFKETVINYDDYHFHSELGVICQDAVVQEIDAIQQYHILNGGESLVGFITLSGEEESIENMRKVVAAYRYCVREHDMIGYAGYNKCVFLVLDCNQKYIDSILQRIDNSVGMALADSASFKIDGSRVSRSSNLLNMQ